MLKKNHTNGRTEIKLESLSFPSYEEMYSHVQKVAGKRPALPMDLSKGDWTEQSLKVLTERYLRRNEDGEVIETPEELCWRVAWDIASAEARWGKTRSEIITTAKEFYQMLTTHEFLPNSPTLMNAGTGNGLQYSACFVLPVGDSLVEIFDAIKYQALIHQTGGGTGFAFSRLRPHGEMVKSSRGTASGPVSFMKIFDAATNEIKQGGKRRGANMGILRVDHPDILEFIHCKEEGGVTNFNISVAITDKFMEALKNDEEYELYSPRTDKTGTVRKVVGKLSAKLVWDEIAQGAWRTGDPGLIFLDRINKGTSNPVPPIGPVESTNPCGEQPLYPYDSCNLGSIFLNYFVKTEGERKVVDWEKLKKVSRLTVRFLDNVIEMNPYPLDAIRQTSLAIRRIGLGVGGWADMLVDLGIPYDSDEALKLGEEIMRVIQEEGVEASQILAKERGPFPMWPVSIYKNDVPRRNSTVTTIAPTGSISIIAGSSSGIEPLFAIAYQHIVKDKHLDRTLTFINPKFEEVAKKRGVWSETIKEKVAQHGIVHDIEEIPQDIRRIFSTAHEIHHDWHIKHQAAFQKYTENAVSKTINMANSVTVDEIKNAYMLAWETNCNGVTVFRDGCKDAQVLNLGVNKKSKVEEKETKVWERPIKIYGSTYKVKTPVGTAFVTVNHDEDNNPVEVFINIGKAGTDVQAMAEALGRLISKSLKFGGNLTARDRAMVVIDQLRGIGGRRSVGFGPNKVLSLPDAIALALSWHLGLANGIETHQEPVQAANSTSNVPVNSNGANGHSNGLNSGVPMDAAGAVMKAFPAQQAGLSSSSDLTMASAESMVSPGQETLGSEGYHVTQSTPSTGDICPSCGASSLVFQEGCSKCYSCGHSEC